MADEAIRMTRAEYEAMYGEPPPAATPIRMTRAEYEAAYGEAPTSTVDGGVRTWGDSAMDAIRNLVGGSEDLQQAGMFLMPGPLSAFGGMSEAIGRAVGVENPAAYPIARLAEALRAGRQEVVSDPQTQNASNLEKAAQAGVRALPSAVVGGGAAVPAVASSFMSGVGGEVARQQGYSPLIGALIGGASAGGLVEGGSRGLRLLTKGGREEIAAEIVKKAVGEEGLSRLLKAQVDDSFGPQTIGEVAKTPGAANLQLQIAKEIGDEGGNAIVGDSIARQAKRVETLKKLAPGSFADNEPGLFGDVIQSSAKEQRSAAKEVVERMWDAVERNGQEINISYAAKRVAQQKAATIGPKGISSSANKIIDALADAAKEKKKIDIGLFQKIRSDAGEQLAEAAAKGKNKEAALMATVRDQLDRAANRAAKSSEGTAKDVSNLRRAIAITRKFETIYSSGIPGRLGKVADSGNPSIANSDVVQSVLAKPEAARGFMRAYGKKLEAVGAMRAGMLDRMAKVKSDAWPKFFNERRGQFRAIFGEDFVELKKVIDDISSEESVKVLAQMASGRAPATGQFLTTASFMRAQIVMARALAKGGGAIGAGIGGTKFGFPGAAIGYGLGKGAETISRAALKDIDGMILNSARDARFAKILAAKPTRETIELAMKSPMIKAAMVGGAQSARAGEFRPMVDWSGNPASSDASPSPESPYSNRLSPYMPSEGRDKLSQEPVGPQSTARERIPQFSPALPRSGQSAKALSSDNDSTKKGVSKGQSQAGEVTKKNVAALVAKQHPLVRAIVAVESSGNPSARSPKGAIGLMQVMPVHFKRLKADGDDPISNLRVGIAVLNEELERFDRDPRLAIAAYNAGSPAVYSAIRRAQSRQWSDIKRYLPKETQLYVPKVMTEFSRVS